MSTRRAPRSSPAKRVSYKPPRDRRELLVAIGVAVLIVVVTATLVWFLRPNRDQGGSTDAPVLTVPPTQPTDATGDTETTTPTDAADPTATTGAPPDATETPAEPATSSPEAGSG